MFGMVRSGFHMDLHDRSVTRETRRTQDRQRAAIPCDRRVKPSEYSQFEWSVAPYVAKSEQCTSNTILAVVASFHQV